MDIVTDYDALSVRSDEVNVLGTNPEIRDIITKLKEKVREDKLSGLSAIQLGYDKRIFVINFNGEVITFINPIITETKGFELSRETCPSLPGKIYLRPRFNNIRITYTTPLGKIESRQLLGLAAKVFQHEVDHLDGILLSDIGLEIDKDFDKATKKERNEVINAYLDSLDIKQKILDEQVENDADLKQIRDAVDFIEAVKTGKVTLEEDNNNGGK